MTPGDGEISRQVKRQRQQCHLPKSGIHREILKAATNHRAEDIRAKRGRCLVRAVDRLPGFRKHPVHERHAVSALRQAAPALPEGWYLHRELQAGAVRAVLARVP